MLFRIRYENGASIAPGRGSFAMTGGNRQRVALVTGGAVRVGRAISLGLARAGQPVDQSEDIVQDILLAVHLKRHTWDANAPFAPWLFAIARNKLIDALRREQNGSP